MSSMLCLVSTIVKLSKSRHSSSDDVSFVIHSFIDQSAVRTGIHGKEFSRDSRKPGDKLRRACIPLKCVASAF
jgi:hypothetical protein